MCLKTFLDGLLKKPEIEPKTESDMPLPTVSKIVDSNYIFNILNNALPTAPHIYISDNEYELCPKEDLVNFLAWDNTNNYIYAAETFDCDDFSYRLTGQLSIPEWSRIAFGIIWTEAHAFCLFIDCADKLWFVEPQSDTLFDTWQSYFGNEIQFVMI